MTCAECKALLNTPFDLATNAELCAVRNHAAGCFKCASYALNRCEPISASDQRKVDLAVANRLAECADDPECQL